MCVANYLLWLRSDDDDEEAAAAPAAEKPEGEAPVVEGEEAEEEQKAEKPAKLDSVLRVYEIEELADMRPQALMAKIAALEGASLPLLLSSIAYS